jgi:virulence factor Mce-like protein
MRPGRRAAADIFDNPILIGTITILITLVAVYLSYIAQNGLPFVPSYSINVDVENASELAKNADVRIGGARVGQVLAITPEPASATWSRPFARLRLSLQKSVEPLPYDTHYQVRLASVLGGKYVEIIPGQDKNTPTTPALSEGGTFYLNEKNAALNHNIPFVDLDTAFNTFGPNTQKGVRNTVGALGEAVAGRGTQFNDTIHGLRQLIGPLGNVLRLLSAPSTHLSRFISGTAGATSALAGVAPTISALLFDGATTLSALERAGPALGSTIDQLPQTESVGTTVLTHAQPVLADAAAIVRDLKPSAALLPVAVARLDTILTNATPVFKRVPQLASTLQTSLSAVDKLARDPATSQSFKLLSGTKSTGGYDLATFGSSAFVGLGAILHAIAPAQIACNVAGIWIRNLASTFSEGDAAGTWIRFSLILDLPQMLLASKPSPDLHVNPYPIENSSQCQAGNEGYTPGQRIGNPPPTGTTVDNTAPPRGVLARGASVGLVPGATP